MWRAVWVNMRVSMPQMMGWMISRVSSSWVLVALAVTILKRKRMKV